MIFSQQNLYRQNQVMKLFTLILLLIVYCNSFSLNPSSTHPSIQDLQSTQSPSQLQSCAPGQIDIVYSSIGSCEVSDIDSTVECISNTITRTYNSQQWNVFAKNTAQNKDVVLFWRFNNCYVSLVNYGKFNRTYIIWPVMKYLNGTQGMNQGAPNNLKQAIFPTQQQKQSRQSEQQSESIHSKRALQSEPNADCPQWKKNTVNTLILACAIDGNDRAADCLFTKVREELGEYWNVCVSTSLLGTSIEYFYYGSCSVSTDGSDSYRRYISVWKAH